MENVAEVLAAIGAPEGDAGGEAAPAEGGETEASEGAEQGEETEADSDGEAEEPSAPAAAAAPQKGQALADALFTDAALATPEGLNAARAAVQEHFKEQRQKQRDFDRSFARLQKREGKFKHTVKRWQQGKQADEAFVAQVRADVNALRSGNASTRLETLGRIMGQAGHEAFNELAEALVADGKRGNGKADPETVALRRELAEVKTVLEAQRADQVRGHEEARIESWRGQIVNAATPEEFPHLSTHLSGPNRVALVDHLLEMKVDAHEGRLRLPDGRRWPKGVRLDDAQALRMLEAQIRDFESRAPSAAGTGTRVKTRQQAPSPPPKIRSIGPSVASQQSGASVDLTDEERTAELVRDPDFLAQLGFQNN